MTKAKGAERSVWAVAQDPAEMLVARGGTIEDAYGHVRVSYERAAGQDEVSLTIDGPQGRIGELCAHRHWIAWMLPVLTRALAEATASGLLPDEPGSWWADPALREQMLKQA